MKLDNLEAILSILDAGGKHECPYYALRNKNGQLHREGGPAIVHPDGTRIWYQNGKPHRDDGPAVIYPNGRQEWYWNGALVNERIGEGYRQSSYTGKDK